MPPNISAPGAAVSCFPYIRVEAGLGVTDRVGLRRLGPGTEDGAPGENTRLVAFGPVDSIENRFIVSAPF